MHFNTVVPFTTALAFLQIASTSIGSVAGTALDPNAKPKVQVCDPKVLPPGWQAGVTTAPLEQVSEYQTQNSNNKLTCSGTVVVIDGCSFQIRNFTYLNALVSKFYGGIAYADAQGNKVSNPNGVSFVNQEIGAWNKVDSQIFQLVTSPSYVAYSWFSVNELRIFDTTQQQLVCVAQLPYDNPFAKNIPAGAVTSGVFSEKSSSVVASTSSSSSGSSSDSSSSSSSSSSQQSTSTSGALSMRSSLVDLKVVIGSVVGALVAAFGL
jgi:hypothetical protein